MVKFQKSDRLPALEVDLYFSPDREEWHYTSSCPINVSVQEMWPHPVPYLAVANERRAAFSEEMLCD